MRIRNLITYGVLLSGVVAMTGCKPTEKNYKSAYDAALAKRSAEAADPDLNLPSGGYRRVGDPEMKSVNGKDYPYLFVRLKPRSEGAAMKAYNVAVSVYKMPTNCDAQVADLRSEGYPAFGAETGDDRFYVIIGSYPTLEEAASGVDEYTSENKEAVYVGLPSPVIIRTP